MRKISLTGDYWQALLKRTIYLFIAAESKWLGATGSLIWYLVVPVANSGNNQ